MLDLLSYIGMVMLLLALPLNRKKHLTSDVFNLLGSLSLTVWANANQAWAIFILDFVWSIISTVSLIRDLRKY
jgi:hypothetical protein